MRRPQRPRSEPLFTISFAVWSLLQGALVLTLVAGLYVMALRQNLPDPDARSLAFAALVATNLGLVLVNRSLGASIFSGLHGQTQCCGRWWLPRPRSWPASYYHSMPAGAPAVPFRAIARDDIAVALACGLASLLFLELAKKLFHPLRARRFRQATTVGL